VEFFNENGLISEFHLNLEDFSRALEKAMQIIPKKPE
jgi:hypothetical protein